MTSFLVKYELELETPTGSLLVRAGSFAPGRYRLIEMVDRNGAITLDVNNLRTILQWLEQLD